MKNQIGSSATRRNWKELNSSPEGRLTSRANKTHSTKYIVPVEYSRNLQTLTFVKHFRELLGQFEVFDLIKALALELLRVNRLLHKAHVIAVLREYDLQMASLIPAFDPPLEEWDLLGLCYQALLTEGLRNRYGIYYTPQAVAYSLTESLQLEEGCFLDPCCGSGSLLLSVNLKDPDRIYGIDNDPVAVFIAKCNLLLRFKRKTFKPHVFCLNFHTATTAQLCELLPADLRAIATNPPWGAVAADQTATGCQFANESFALFFVRSYKLVAAAGQLSFLFPQALLNVAAHTKLRRFILTNCDLKSLRVHGPLFSGVTTGYVALGAQKKTAESPAYSEFTYITDKSELIINSRYFDLLPNFCLLPLSAQDADIIKKMQNLGKLSLNNSIFALGIVTGDNQHKLSTTPQPGWEPIISGRELRPFFVAEPQNYIFYQRDQLQQVAADEIYRAREKLIYKFISSTLVFAYDNKQRLVLNSANILIPKAGSLSILTVMALLNSQALRFYYLKTCNELKILKSNLCHLPLPQLTAEQDQQLAGIALRIINGHSEEQELSDSFIFELFRFTPAQRDYVRTTLLSGNEAGTAPAKGSVKE